MEKARWFIAMSLSLIPINPLFAKLIKGPESNWIQGLFYFKLKDLGKKGIARLVIRSSVGTLMSNQTENNSLCYAQHFFYFF